MPEARLAELFRAERGPSSKGTEDEAGSGLGLAICAELVRRHGGRIWAERNQPKGLNVRFTLPAQSKR
jgi:signal transduction histidine kinase